MKIIICYTTDIKSQLTDKCTRRVDDVDYIVFEHLDTGGKIRSKKYKERIHMWRKRDVQSRVELQAHRHGMRISRVCA